MHLFVGTSLDKNLINLGRTARCLFVTSSDTTLACKAPDTASVHNRNKNRSTHQSSQDFDLIQLFHMLWSPVNPSIWMTSCFVCQVPQQSCPPALCLLSITAWVRHKQTSVLCTNKQCGTAVEEHCLHTHLLMDIISFVIVWLNFTETVLHCRPAAGDLLRASLLVLYSLLRAEPACGGDLPRLSALADSGRIHRSIQLWAFLPGPAV